MKITHLLLSAVASLTALGAIQPAMAQTYSTPDQLEFRELYRELVETNTTLSEGDCTLASRRMADHLLAAGYPAEDVRVLVPAEFPKSGSLVATLRGSDPEARAIGMMAHIDVVEASAADWGRDPFILQEADGYFSARGVMDDKAQAAMWVDTLVRLKREGFTPRRDLRIMLTCGEETPAHFNGVRWLMAEHPDVFDVAYIINEGARGRLDPERRRISLEVQLGEKTYQDYTLETTNVGGHSSRPLKDNAITRLSQGLARLGAHDFPVELNAATRAHFTALAEMTPAHAETMRRLVANESPDVEAATRLSADPAWNSMLRTTCVATQVTAGHAPNALPQRARANVNCRILPGHSAEEVRTDLIRVLDDPGITVVFAATPDPDGVTPPLNDEILAPIRDIAARMWPGVPVIPTMATGATDGRYTNAAGIPTYGITGVFTDADGGNNHGINERIHVRSLYEARDFLYELIKVYAMGL